MRSLLIGLVVLILLGFGTYYLIDTNTTFQSNTSTPTSTTTPTNTGSDDQTWSSDIPNDYRLHIKAEQQYSLGLPFAVDVSSPQPNIIRYRYVGPNNEPASEITDGYTVTISTEESDETSLDALLPQAIEHSERITIAENEARWYQSESELGNKPITNYMFLPGNGYAYRVSVNLSPANNSEYTREVFSILETIQFFDEPTATSLRSRIVPIAMLDYEAVDEQYIRESSGAERGCDRVVLIEHVLPSQTQTPLNASLEQLFAYEESTVGGWQNFIASQNNTLDFDRATIEDGVAKIYLTGELGPLGGVCDNPRAAIQIEETALAYDTVGSVELFLNGEPTNLTPSGRGE